MLQGPTAFLTMPRHNDFGEGRLTPGSHRGLAEHTPEPHRAEHHARSTTNSEVNPA